MGRAPCCEKVGLRRGRWTAEEDTILANYIAKHGEGSWRSLPKHAGLLRCGKSCRLRWINYLRDGLKRGNFSKEEDDLIVKLHATLGNRWSLIANYLPGRTDNEIKNYWKLHLSRQIHTFWRTCTMDKDITITFDIKKIYIDGKRCNGQSLSQLPRINTTKRPTHEPGKTKDNSIQVNATSSPLHKDGDRSTMAYTEQNLPNTMSVTHASDRFPSEADKWHMSMDPMDLTGDLEPNNAVDQVDIHETNNLLNHIEILKEGSVMEALISNNVRRDSGLLGIKHDGISQVNGLLGMDWKGFVSHLWDQSAQNDLLQAFEPQTVTCSKSDELESFVSWLMSDV